MVTVGIGCGDAWEALNAECSKCERPLDFGDCGGVGWLARGENGLVAAWPNAEADGGVVGTAIIESPTR